MTRDYRSQYRSVPRNKQIADVFKASGLIGKYGSGIRRILQDCENEGLETPAFAEMYGGFSVTLYNKSSTPQK